jgi:microcystin-dependent protein
LRPLPDPPIEDPELRPYIGELRLMSFALVPKHWIPCDGQLLPKNDDNAALFALISTTYGGDGVSNFAVPDLRGRVPVGSGEAWELGKVIGSEQTTLTADQIPPHTHQLYGTTDSAISPNPVGAVLASENGIYATYDPEAVTPLEPASIATVGGEPHENRPPYLGLVWCIAISGFFPSRG